ncbi:hypothetical protein BDQ17DRAFT_1431952 [Cyathus striatus]|nr:hypothetical protein BDQ17DRAFT_1431952 [Cyathus striatus]
MDLTNRLIPGAFAKPMPRTQDVFSRGIASVTHRRSAFTSINGNRELFEGQAEKRPLRYELRTEKIRYSRGRHQEDESIWGWVAGGGRRSIEFCIERVWCPTTAHGPLIIKGLATAKDVDDGVAGRVKRATGKMCLYAEHEFDVRLSTMDQHSISTPPITLPGSLSVLPTRQRLPLLFTSPSKTSGLVFLS